MAANIRAIALNHHSQAFDIAAYERRVDADIARRFRSSGMPNSEWRRVFTTLDREDLYLERMMLKKVGKDSPLPTWIPKSCDLAECWVEEGSGHFSYFYEEIEWVEFLDTNRPRGWETVPGKHIPQDCDRVLEILEGIGSFDTTRTPSGIVLRGYRA